MTEFVSVYITAKDVEEAEKIANVLVDEKLAACVNIIPGIVSIYNWKGNKERSEEISMFVKTKKSLVKEVIEKVKSVHSYDVPCIVSFPILEGDEDYLKYIEEETK
ncbi:MAG: divalent-cation tolerance protein CutA [Nanoarchaeota archaeon]|nr:divalent-cation tolerance protein CutA [Nanoarchaeota archaeon]MBU1134980.1 divalent-cation tolerance protein CutA [Nanoarchaeota archaeon]MBU2519805.1 divalent-cation tolerance protein CutA [Nanoarchaeota archaeon]